MAAKKTSTSRVQSRVFWLASVLFFISGGTGLVYQVIWFKRFSHVWGSSSLAFAAVGGSFLFGLGLGAYLLGRWADRAVVPLRWYGVCELLIGLMALLIPYEIGSLVDAAVGLYGAIPEQPMLRYLVQFAITLLVIGPPCILMGGTLPLLIRQLTARDGSLDQATGWLYAINTFGAAAGCYLTGFHFLPTLGMTWTNNLAAAVNIAIGVVSLAASTSIERLAVAKGPKVAPEPVATIWSSPRMLALYVATALSGCAALVLEMTWTRQLALVLGGSTYAYTATLFVVLVGIALGSLIFHLFLRPVASSPYLPIAVIGIVISGILAGMWMLPYLSLWAGDEPVRNLRGEPWTNGLACVGLSAALELIPAVSMGVLFPLFVHLTRASAARVGATVGNIYAWNTLGSIAGASLTSVLLFPSIGTAGASALSAGMYLVSLLCVLPWQGATNLVRGTVAGAVGVGLVALIAQPIDPRRTNVGLYLYGSESFRKDPRAWIEQASILMFAEGASSNVLVTKAYPNSVALRVNGKVDASNGVDMATQTGSAYFPRIFKPDAKEVMVIGFGSGCTPGRSLIFPDTHVTCCELEPAVYAASEHFGLVNGRPHCETRAWLEAENAKLPESQRLSADEIAAKARLSMIFGDGRTAVQGSAKKYDLVISEPSNPWIAGCSNLFTREFFRSTREHLTDGGVLAQWIQAYSFTVDDYAMIVRTMRTEFPHFGVVLLAGGVDTLLLASNRPLVPDADQLALMQKHVDESPVVKADLETWFGGSDLRWLLVANYLLGEKQLNALVDRDPQQADIINTDLHLRLEFDAPLHLFRSLAAEETASVALPKAIGNWPSDLAKSLGLTPNTPEFFTTLGDYALRQAENFTSSTRANSPTYLSKANHFYGEALKLDARHQPALVGQRRVQLRQDRKSDPEKVLRELIQIAPDDAVARYQLAEVMLRSKRRPEAIALIREALERSQPLSFDKRTFVWANDLAWMLATSPEAELRNPEEAVRWALAACETTEYDNPAIMDTLSTALAAVGRYDEAIEMANRVIALAADQPELIAGARERIKLYEAKQPYIEKEKP